MQMSYLYASDFPFKRSRENLSVFRYFMRSTRAKKSKTDKEFCFLAFLLVIFRKIWQTGSKTIYREFMFAGINIFWARLRLILARAARGLESIEKINIKLKKNDNKTV